MGGGGDLHAIQGGGDAKQVLHGGGIWRVPEVGGADPAGGVVARGAGGDAQRRAVGCGLHPCVTKGVVCARTNTINPFAEQGETKQEGVKKSKGNYVPALSKKKNVLHSTQPLE